MKRRPPIAIPVHMSSDGVDADNEGIHVLRCGHTVVYSLQRLHDAAEQGGSLCLKCPGCGHEALISPEAVPEMMAQIRESLDG